MSTPIENTPIGRRLNLRKNGHKSKLPKKVAVIYTDAKREYFLTDEEFVTVDGSKEEAEAFGPTLKSLGVNVCYIVGDKDIAKNLEREKPDMAINLVTTVKGYDYLGATIPATLELLEIPYTGTDILGFALGSNKYLVYSLLSQHGVQVPNFQLMTRIDTPLDDDLKFPLILKLNEEHSNIEIKRESVVENEVQLRKRLKYLLRKYEQDVLVSEFIDGKEYAAFVFQGTNKKVYMIERIIKLPDNKTQHEFLDYDLVWNYYVDDTKNNLRYQKYKDPKLEKIIKQAFDIARMMDYGKFDIRQDYNGNYFIIDANQNCHFAPPSWYCEMTNTFKRYGVSFKTILKRMMLNTMQEWGY